MEPDVEASRSLRLQLFTPRRSLRWATAMPVVLPLGHPLEAHATNGALMIVLPSLPLDWWRESVGHPLNDLDRPRVSYRVLRWGVGDESSSPTGAALHEIYAELLRLPRDE